MIESSLRIGYLALIVYIFLILPKIAINNVKELNTSNIMLRGSYYFLKLEYLHCFCSLTHLLFEPEESLTQFGVKQEYHTNNLFYFIRTPCSNSPYLKVLTNKFLI